MDTERFESFGAAVEPSKPDVACVRFWIYWNRSPVKITLRRGQTFDLYKFEITEEGNAWESERYYFIGDHVKSDVATGGRDCDGQQSNSTDSYCSIADLKAGIDYDGVIYPKWITEMSRNYDQYAELMNY